MCENRFYICRHCGNLIGLIDDAGVPIVCCGEEMEHLEPIVNESGSEKHLPVVKISNNIVKVRVGSTFHPMENDHSINWVYLQTDRGGQRKCLLIGDDPCVEFALHKEEPQVVFAYCNKHGLWKKEI